MKICINMVGKMKKLTTILILVIILVSLVSLTSLTSALIINNVQTSPSQIKPGETARIIITLKNDENKDIEDVSLQLVLDEVPLAPHDSSNEVTLDEIEEDDEEDFEFKVIALSDAKSGIYKIPIEIKYKLDEDIKQRSGLISLTINAVPEIDVQVEDGTLLKGKQNELIVKIVNKGLSDVEFLEIDVVDGIRYSILGPKNVYIGKIVSDDFDTAEFKIHFKENAPGLMNLPVRLKYRDVTNKQYTESYNLQLKTYSIKEAIQLGLIKQSRAGTYVGFIIFIIIIYITYRKIKKARKAKKARQEATA